MSHRSLWHKLDPPARSRPPQEYGEVPVDYAYHAVRTAADGFGQVVAGREPEFEEASVMAGSFEEFLSSLLSGAPDGEPGAAADRGRM